MALQHWLERRRLRKLEDINRELEALKHHGVQPSPPSNLQDARRSDHFRPRSSAATWWVILAGILVIVLLSFFYRSKFNDLNEQYDLKRDELATLQGHVDNLTDELDEKESELLYKKRIEADLSGQYQNLTSELEAKDDQITTLTAQITTKDDQVKNLTAKLKAKDDEIEEIEDCVENASVTDKEDCV